MANNKTLRREKIKKRVRGKISGTSDKPRLSVFRSNSQIYAQLIDDVKGVTLLSSSSMSEDFSKSKETKTNIAGLVGKKLAQNAIANGITKVVFDRNGYLYHGRVKSLADGAREGGLIF